MAVLFLWLSEPEQFTHSGVERYLLAWGPWAFAGFALVSFVRGAVLLPSTPFVLAGGALFPNALAEVLLVSMLGIVASATLLYRFPGFAGYDSLLEAKYPAQLARLQVHALPPDAPRDRPG